MPRSKKRVGNGLPPEDDDRHYSKRQRNNSSSGRRCSKSEESTFNPRKCTNWFQKYTQNDNPNLLGPEGMEKFCIDIGVEPENIVMLVLAWKMNARQMGYFSLQEWMTGCREIQCDSALKMQSKLEYLRTILEDQTSFKSIYRYAYDFARDKDQRSMDLETAKAMLQLLLGSWSLFNKFTSFLDHSKYKVINKDQWYNILEFSRTISLDLTNYDIDGAWPVMLDEFVEWLKLERNKLIRS